MRRLITFLLLLIAGNSFAQTASDLNYSIADKKFKGYVAMPAKTDANTKTILIVHEWWGLNQYPKNRAMQLAKEGYIAVCIDMYGADVVVDNPQDAGKLAGAYYADPKLAYERFNAAYQEALKIKGVNKDKMLAIGYCFGGSMVLNAAKMGADLDAVVSFHGGLTGPALDKKKLKASILVCNGASDSFVSKEEIENFKKEMNENGVDYQFIDYADATHAFTNPYSTEVGKKFGIPIAYNEAADKKSYADFIHFMNEKVK